MSNLLLKLTAPYLNSYEADGVRAEIAALNPRMHLVMADWPWLEVRGITELRAKALLVSLEARGMRFREIEKKKARVAA